MNLDELGWTWMNLLCFAPKRPLKNEPKLASRNRPAWQAPSRPACKKNAMTWWHDPEFMERWVAKARFDPQTGNLALSQPKITMAVFCWVAVDPQPESPLRNREILCPRAVSQILVSCSYRVPSCKDCILSLSFMFLLSFLRESPLIFIVSHCTN